jgi:hypothetical protein
MARRRAPDPEAVRKERERLQALERVEQATRTLRESERATERAREELREAVADAYRLGVTLTVLGRVVGVTRQRVSKMIRG